MDSASNLSVAITYFVLAILCIITQSYCFDVSYQLYTYELYHSQCNIMVSKLNYIAFAKDWCL